MTRRKKLPAGWRKGELRKYARIRSGTVNPMRFPTEVFELHSIPAFDNSKQPELMLGRNIRSSKALIQPSDCLFSKLNPRISRVWLVSEPDGNRQIATTEFWPLHSKTDENGKLYILGEFLEFYLAWPKFTEAFVGQVEASTKSRQRLKRDQLLEQQILLPPLAEQEGIVEVLRRADVIRRKRAEARRLADQILPALFIDLFGDPITNPKKWPVEPIGDLLAPEIERVDPKRAFPDEAFTYIEIGNIDNQQFRIVEPKRLLGQDAPSRARQVVRAGDVLYSMTRPNLRNIAVVPEEHEGAIGTTGFAILRPKRPADTAFIFEIVKSPAFTDAMARFAEAKSLYPAVDEPEIRRFPVMTPPSGYREQFAATYDFLSDLSANNHQAGPDAEHLFSVLLNRAFTGELTAQDRAVVEDSP